MVCFATPLCPFLDQPANRPPGVTARPGSGRGHVRKIPKQPEDKDQNGGDTGQNGQGECEEQAVIPGHPFATYS